MGMVSKYMNQQTFIIGNREFTCMPMNAFDANRLFLRIQKVATPIIGAMVGSGKSVGDIDVKEAAGVIAEHLDESIMDSIVLPMFEQSKVFDVENKRFIKSGMDINQCFTTETLFDFYELAFEVGKHQFGPFFRALASRFGSLLAAAPTTKQSTER